MTDSIKKKKKQQPEMIPIPPWDPKRPTPWKKIPSWVKSKRVKPTLLKDGEKKKKVEYIKRKKVNYEQ